MMIERMDAMTKQMELVTQQSQELNNRLTVKEEETERLTMDLETQQLRGSQSDSSSHALVQKWAP